MRQPVLLACYDPAMGSPIDELLPVTEATATAWILSAPAGDGQVPALASFELELELGPAGEAPATPLPGWLPARWCGHSSARALAALGLLEAGAGAVLQLTLGRQMLGLRRD